MNLINKIKNITPNWFQKPISSSPEMGSENQFGSTRGLRYGPLRINKTGIFVNNGTLDSTILNASGFHGFGLTGTEQITFDASTGVNVTDGTNSVFKAEISGTNIGDVTMGAYGSSAGVFYDKSAGTFTIKGALTAGSISIGAGSPAPFTVTSAGALTATGANISGTITSTAGTIGGWTLGATSLSANSVILSSAGSITVGDGDDKVVLDITSSVGYVSFYAGGALKGRLRGLAAGGISVVSGDMAVDNNESFLAKGTGSSYAAFSVDGSNHTILESTDDDAIYLQDSGGHSLATFGTSNVFLGGSTHPVTLQLYNTSEPSPPSANTILIYLDVSDGVLKAKIGTTVHNLW